MIIMKFDSSPWIDRLRDDEALTGNLDDDQARRLLSWGGTRLAASASTADAERVLAAMREVNRRAGEGDEPEPLLAALEGEMGTGADGEDAPDEPEIAGELPPPDGTPEKRPTAGATSSTENNQRQSSTS